MMTVRSSEGHSNAAKHTLTEMLSQRFYDTNSYAAEVPMLVNNTGRIRCNDSSVPLLSPIIPPLSFLSPHRPHFIPYGRLDVHFPDFLFFNPVIVCALFSVTSCMVLHVT
jgi:hypothetical protein